MNIQGGSVPSKHCGGTADALPRERARASFDPKKLESLLKGGEKSAAQNAEWKDLFNEPLFDFTYDVHDDRTEAFKKSMERTVRAYRIVKENPDLMSVHMAANLGQGGPGFFVGGSAQSGSSAASNHYGIFVGAILARASDEQKAQWFRKAINMEILGAYAQTELGHGSNVRALETTATYDHKTEEFVIDSPTLTSLKWWPGCFGIAATHAVVYARLILNGKDYGIHEFMVQLRDENHRPMPGIEVGDVGPKIGYNLVDNGYCRFNEVRIPRTNMLSRYQYVTKEGEYKKHDRIQREKGAASEKLKYIVMITTRVGMVSGAYSALAKAATTAIRYSAVRHQGFKNTRTESIQSGENPVLDYQVQQYRLFKSLSMAYAFHFVAKYIQRQLIDFHQGLQSGDVSALPELHATAAGLKAFCTNIAGDLIEECRRCCGGHGATLSSGVAKLMVDYNAIAPIAEGDKIILVLQTARFLVRSAEDVQRGSPAVGQARYIEVPPPQPSFDRASLRDLSALVQAFAWRAHQCVWRATKLFSQRLKAGEDFDVAWNNCAVALCKAAETHCFLVILSNFVSSIGQITDGPIRSAMERLAIHFALVHIRENAGDWLGCLDTPKLESINDQIVVLLGEIRPDAVALVDSFGFSDKELHSAIGRYDGNVYEALYDYAKNSPLNKDEYIREVWQSSLRQVLDQDYLRQGKEQQRAGPVSKL